jgi:ribosomal protein S27E
MADEKVHEIVRYVSDGWFTEHTWTKVICPNCNQANEVVVSGHSIKRCDNCGHTLVVKHEIR